MPRATSDVMNPDKDDKTWIVALVVFGLMGVGGPILGLILFFILANFT